METKSSWLPTWWVDEISRAELSDMSDNQVLLYILKQTVTPEHVYCICVCVCIYVYNYII